MFRLGLLTAFIGCLLLGPGAAAKPRPGGYQWKPGQVLTYRVEEVIKALEEVEGAKAEAATKINMIKRWQVLAVDQTGTATMQLSLTALRQETTTGDEPLIFDSAKPEQSNPQLREQLSKWVGTPLAVLRVDPRGLVVKVKESKQGGRRYESEPPFVLVLPSDGAKAVGQGWERSYQVTLEPPQGTGEKYPAVQKYSCKAADAAHGKHRIGDDDPDAAAGRRGPDAAFAAPDPGQGDLRRRGRRHAARRLSVDKELKGHQSEGSSYRLIRTYQEELIGD